MIKALVALFAAVARDWIPSRRILPQPVPSTPATVVTAAPLGTPTRAIGIREETIATIGAPVQRASDWKIPRPPPNVAPERALMAMDDAMSGNFSWMVASQFSEGLEFFGYPYLAELTQRAEYRRPAEIIAKAMTMKWIKLQATGETDKSDKIHEIEEALEALQAKDRFQIMALHDGFFGRGQLFIDMGTNDVPGELKTKLTVTREKIDASGIRNLQPVEAMWSYPNQYNSVDPLKKDFFKPETWYVMGTEVHHTRLLTMVSRPVPDMLKPTYAFGGLSLTQISKPYVDNWLRTRQSISDLIHNFSVMVLSTDLGDVLNMGAGQQIFNRANLFNKARDNRGLFLINKDSEELTNVAVPLGTLDALQAQAQEHMAAVNGIPLIILFGITPTGLNATADPELKEFARSILAGQEDFIRPPLTRVIRMIQVAKWGGWDPDITFKFEPLMPEDMKELADTRKTETETDEIRINAGIIDPQEARQRLADEEDSPYSGLDTSKVPTPPQQEDGGGLPGLNPGGEPGPEQPPNPNPEAAGHKGNGVDHGPFAFSLDEWNESDHPRDDAGRFGSGGSGALADETDPTVPPKPGQPFIVYRLGSSGELKNRNAGNAQGVGAFLQRLDDIESSTPTGAGASHMVTAYRVRADKEFGNYALGAQSRSITGDVVGREVKGKSVAYSFPEGGGWNAEPIGQVPLDQLRRIGKELTGYDTFDDMGGNFAANTVREAFKEAIAKATSGIGQDAEWNESKHPRDEAGRFGEGGGGAETTHEEISARLRKEESREQAFAREGRWQKLMTAGAGEHEKMVGSMSREEAKEHLGRLNAAPGDNPAARRVLEAKAGKTKGVDLFAGGGKDEHGFERAPGLDARSRKVEQKFYNAIRKNTGKLIDVYQHRFGNHIDADNFKALSEDFNADRTLAPAVHEPSSHLSKLFFIHALNQKEKAGDTSPTLFTAGGSGSGKSEAMHVAKTVLGLPGAGLVFDSTMSNARSGISKIDQALSRTDAPVEIVYTNTPLEKAFRFNAGRKRAVPLETLAHAHLGASKTIHELAQHYADEPRVQIRVINNAGELHEIQPGSIGDVPQYNESDVARLQDVAQSMRDKGQIDEQRYNYLVTGRGQESSGGLREGEPGEKSAGSGKRGGRKAGGGKPGVVQGAP